MIWTGGKGSVGNFAVCRAEPGKNTAAKSLSRWGNAGFERAHSTECRMKLSIFMCIASCILFGCISQVTKTWRSRSEISRFREIHGAKTSASVHNYFTTCKMASKMHYPALPLQ
jgi:hypothetical protein